MTFRFGPFEADRVSYRVTRERTPLDLTSKQLDLLFYFLDRPGQLVTKEALLDDLWPGANVTENALAQAMSDLRDALDDDPAAPTFIKTIARRGYRFIAEVQTIPGIHSGNTFPEPSATATGSSVQGGSPADDNLPTLAVMDFVNVAGDPEVAWLGAGVAETVTSDLAALGRFRVVDRLRLVDAVRHTSGSVRDVGAAVGARLVVTGSFQRSGPHLRITARMIDLMQGDAVADAKVDGRVEDVFALQDGIVRAFTRELNLTPPASAARTAARETKDLDAYRAYIEGWLKIESLDLDQNPAAIADFARAIALDPRYARAYTGLATAEFIAYEMSRATRTPNFQALDTGIDHSRHALQLDPDLADAHAALSFLLTSALQFDEARRAARRAVALDPDDWRHHFRLGHALWGNERLRALARALELYPHFAYAPLEMAMVHVARGQITEAMAIAQRGAADQDRQSATANRYPSVAFHYLLGSLRAVAGDYESALPEFDREVAQAAQHGLYRTEYAASSLIWRGHATLALDRVDEASEAFQRALTFIDGHPRALLGLAAVMARQGRAGDADRAREQARAFITGVRQPDRSAEWLYGTACLAAASGDAVSAAAALNQLLDQVAPSAVAWQLPIDSTFIGLRGHPAFKSVLARLAERAE
ncbi:MAG TPA: winged helix-turn-helix domain-containing protein [Vicinamibacterales bacterium]|nr:winged helix-turn-helix domain-containing protein [Vicinamibacterales bacterium]